MEAIYLVVKATPARWWHAHKEHITSWDDFKRLMAIRFSNNKEPLQKKYTGESIGYLLNHEMMESRWSLCQSITVT